MPTKYEVIKAYFSSSGQLQIGEENHDYLKELPQDVLSLLLRRTHTHANLLIAPQIPIETVEGLERLMLEIQNSLRPQIGDPAEIRKIEREYEAIVMLSDQAHIGEFKGLVRAIRVGILSYDDEIGAVEIEKGKIKIEGREDKAIQDTRYPISARVSVWSFPGIETAQMVVKERKDYFFNQEMRRLTERAGKPQVFYGGINSDLVSGIIPFRENHKAAQSA